MCLVLSTLTIYSHTWNICSFQHTNSGKQAHTDPAPYWVSLCDANSVSLRSTASPRFLSPPVRSTPSTESLTNSILRLASDQSAATLRPCLLPRHVPGFLPSRSCSKDSFIMTSPLLNLLVGESGYRVVLFVAALVVFIKFSRSSKVSVLVNAGKAFPFSVLARFPSWMR